MKLITITAIQEFEVDLKKILKKSKVNAFSSTSVNGFVRNENPNMEDNWFGGETGNTRSILIFAFVQTDCLDEVFKSIEIFNQKQESESASKIHIAVLNVEKSNQKL